MHQICRTCLKEIEGIRFVNLKDDTNNTEMQSKLLLCLPELNVDLVLGPVLCTSCADALNSAYIFRTTCLRTEKLIQSYVDTKKLQPNSILLTDFNVQAYLLEASCNENSNAALKTETVENDCTQFEFKDLNHIDDTKDIIIKEELILDDIKIDEDDGDLASMQSSFSCDKCEFETIHESSLRVHQEIKHFKKFTCNLCKYETNMESHYTNHMKLHRQESPSQYSTMCSFNTKHKPAVEIHERLSFNKKTTCSICGYRTTTFSALKAHMASHNFNIVTGYIFYSREICKEAVQEDPNCNFEELLKTISNEWESLTSLEKLKWVERASGVNTSSKTLDASASPARTSDHQMTETNKKRKNWVEESMRKAIADVKSKKMGYLKASKLYNVPRTTLEHYVKNKSNIDTKLGRKAVLSIEMEQELVDYCLDMERRYFGISARDIRNMAFQLATRNGLSHPFADGSAGKKWLKQFIARHPQLRLRKHQRVSSARINGFTAENAPAKNKPDEKRILKVKKQLCDQIGSRKAQAKKRRSALPSSSSSPSSNDDEDADEDSEANVECIFCAGSYSKDQNGESWIRCIKCTKWCHQECAGTTKYKRYICDLCQ